jgi:transcriptional regulator with XRE-family HTH domain
MPPARRSRRPTGEPPGRKSLRTPTLAQQLQRARGARQLSLDALATATGINRRTLERYERGVYAPSAHRLVAIAQVLECPVERLRNGALLPVVPPPRRGRPTVRARQLAENIRRARTAHQLTQAALAAALGVRRLTIGRYERGLNAPTPAGRRALAAVLRVEVAMLTATDA